MTFWNTAQRQSPNGCLRTMLVIVTSLVLTGCAFGRASLGDDIRQDDVAAIKRGVSSRSDVVSRIGPPDRIIQTNDHEIMQYYHYDLKSSSLLLLLVNFSRFNIKSDDLFVLVNREGKVEDVLYGRRTDRLTFQFWPFGD